jgi:RNA polymerase primary sigma factor
VKQRASRWYDRQSSLIYVPDRLRMPLARLAEELCGDLRTNPEALAKKIHITKDELTALKPLVNRAASLESPIQGTERRLSDSITTPATEGDTSQHDFNVLQERIAAALKVLPERERTVVSRCFGLDGGEPGTLVAVGKELRITKERVRQLRNRAVEKLRNGRFGAELARLMEDMKE